MHGKIVDICLFMDIVIEILGNTYRMMCGIIHSQLMTNEKKANRFHWWTTMSRFFCSRKNIGKMVQMVN